MNLLPYQNIVFRSELNAVDVSKKLREHIKPETATNSGYWGTRNTKEYEGEISGNNFSIQRIIWFWNSFLPVITGTFIQEPGGTKINMKMRLPTLALISVYLIGVFAIALLIGLATAFYTIGTFSFLLVAPLGFLIFMYLLTTIAFNLECRKSKKDFKKILEAEIES